MSDPINDTEFAEALRTFDQTAFRLELQRAYVEEVERETLARFLAGDPQPAPEVTALREWFVQVAYLTQQGKRVERVRVHEDPPTDYQRWERWIDQWNTEAGETIWYLTRKQAHDIGLLPGVGNEDWWLLDSNRLILMRFDPEGHRVHNELVTDPAAIARACAWRDLAVHHAALIEAKGAAP